MFRRLLLIVPLLLALVGSVATAQDDATLQTAEDPELGTILTDPEGMTLYIFLSDMPNSGESSCYDQCEENWPIFTAEEPLTLPEGVPVLLCDARERESSRDVLIALIDQLIAQAAPAAPAG